MLTLTDEIQEALSTERFAPYLSQCGNNFDAACELYIWNMAVSGAFFPWLNMVEIVLRNRIHFALSAVHGSRWVWQHGFINTLPKPKQGFNPRDELAAVGKKYGKTQQTGKVIADLNFAFWQQMLKKNQLHTLWNKHLSAAFPNLDLAKTTDANRQTLYDHIEQIRKLRNRIAHHEPIHERDLSGDLDSILYVLGAAHSQDFIGWLKRSLPFHFAETSYIEILLQNKP
ncbi:Abi-like protein [Kingella potus]|uniref:Abi-like protein n=1 Tax=Kingella potus TaxID=265175 RepID=A0A377R2D1_9NEIS|nr:Abi family protein [Kingella potus]UOP00686.1 Abi family protein [Kingella potus]STR02917.1 Abi-like protein [Kingella potus]